MGVSTRSLLRAVPAAAALIFSLDLRCQQAPEVPQPSVPHSRVQNAEGLRFLDPLTLAGKEDMLRGSPSRAGEGCVHALVEIPTGTNEKWEVGQDGLMRWDIKNGRPRVVAYLGYPGNYGIVPRTRLGEELDGDGDPLDIVVIGPAARRGELLVVRMIGVIRLVDDGEKDDKILAVPLEGAFGDIEELEQLERRHPGIQVILRTWFLNYKGPGKLQCGGFAGADAAEKLLRAGEESFRRHEESKDSGAAPPGGRPPRGGGL
jgi:inorganic pyrophosphatase